MDIPKIINKFESKFFADLVKFDPVTCAHYYDHQMTTFCNLLKKVSSIFGEVDDFYYFKKFKNRRSEHDHGLLWVKNGPMYGVDSNKTIEQFVEKYVTSNNLLLPSNLKYSQMHKHTQTCRKKNQVICQFHYPLPPMPCIKILKPLKEILSFGKRKKSSDIADRIFETLNNMQMKVDVSFEDFINQLNLNFAIYIDSLCNRLTKPTFFLRDT
jgi:hypothetical protein